MELVKDESAPEIAAALSRTMPRSALTQIKFISSDSPSERLLQVLQACCPSLESLSLDPVHLAIVYEYAQWRKKTSGSKALRRLLHKVCQIDNSKDSNAWGPIFTAGACQHLSREEAFWRKQIYPSTSSQAKAQQILEDPDPETPLLTRVTFVEYIAALCYVHPGEVDRKVTGSNKPVRDVLWSACAPDRLEWLFNNIRFRHSMPLHIGGCCRAAPRATKPYTQR